jgi:hypothetical protein
MTVPVTEMCKIPSMKREIYKVLHVPTKKEDPPIILNTMYLDRPRDKNPPFYLSLGMKGLLLNNCMLDSGASTNVIFEGNETCLFEDNPTLSQCVWY